MAKGEARSEATPFRIHPSLWIHNDVFGRTPSPPFKDDTSKIFRPFVEQIILRLAEGYSGIDGLFPSNLPSTIVTDESRIDNPPFDEFANVVSSRVTDTESVIWRSDPSHPQTNSSELSV
jgi:hypothetical protein